jgi:RNA polymerase sigma factor (sigma-70 family)
MRRRAVDDAGFADFVVAHERRLRQAFTTMWGPDLGREAAVDALAFGWEHWDRVRAMDNPVGYLFVVARNRVNGHRSRRREFPVAELPLPADGRSPSFEPALAALIGGLSERERQVVMLLHSYAWSMSEVAELLDVSKSSIQTYAERALDKLREGLGVEL